MVRNGLTAGTRMLAHSVTEHESVPSLSSILLILARSRLD